MEEYVATLPIYIVCASNDDSYLIPVDKTIIKSKLCRKNARIISASDYKKYKTETPITSAHAIAIDVYNDPLYISHYVSTELVDTIYIIDLLNASKNYVLSGKLYTKIIAYVKNIPCSSTFWQTLSEITEFNNKASRTFKWSNSSYSIKNTDNTMIATKALHKLVDDDFGNILILKPRNALVNLRLVATKIPTLYSLILNIRCYDMLQPLKHRIIEVYCRMKDNPGFVEVAKYFPTDFKLKSIKEWLSALPEDIMPTKNVINDIIKHSMIAASTSKHTRCHTPKIKQQCETIAKMYAETPDMDLSLASSSESASSSDMASSSESASSSDMASKANLTEEEIKINDYAILAKKSNPTYTGYGGSIIHGTTYSVIVPLNKSEYALDGISKFIKIVKFLHKCDLTDVNCKIIDRVMTSFAMLHYTLNPSIMKLLSKHYSPNIINNIYYTFYILIAEEYLITSDFHGRRHILDLDYAALIKNKITLEILPVRKEFYSYEWRLSHMKNCHKNKIHDVKMFKSRLAVFTNGIMDCIDLGACNAYLTGSTMLACASTNVVELSFIEAGYSLDYYFEYMYPSRNSLIDENDAKSLTDIDIAFVVNDHAEYERNIEIFHQQLLKKYPDVKKEYVLKFVKNGANHANDCYKYVFRSEFMIRDIDAYPIFNSIEELMNRFHFPCVKLYYDGNNVKIYASCVAALLTGINIKQIWISKTANYINILMKYMCRGYTMMISRDLYNCLSADYLESKWRHDDYDIHDDAFKHLSIPLALKLYNKGYRCGLREMDVSKIKERVDNTSYQSGYGGNIHMPCPLMLRV